jgi:hypothetical protein
MARPLPSALLLASMLIPTLAPAQASELVDSSTGTRFASSATAGGTEFECLGAGVRKMFTVKVYAVAYCVEAERADAVDVLAHALHPNLSGDELTKALEDDPVFYDHLGRLPGDKLVIMHMVRDVDRAKLADAFRKSLKDVLPPEKVEKLVAAIPSDVRGGENALLYSSGSQLVIDIGGRQSRIDDAQIANQLWTVWLGPDSVSPSLKHSLAQSAAGVGAVSARRG